MACGLVALSTFTGGCSSIGGIIKAYVAEAEDITAMTVDGERQVTALTMSGVDLWFPLVFNTSNDTAFLNETGSKDGNRQVFDITGLMEFSKITNDKRQAANKISQCCALAMIIVYSSGHRALIGLDYDEDTSTFQIIKNPLRVNPDVLSDTGAGSDRVNFNLLGQSRFVGMTTTLTDAAIEAL